jgi:hypothetical protein
MEEFRRLRLAKIRPCDVNRILSRLPQDLNTSYDRILSRIEPTYANEVCAALQWLMYARRPLSVLQLCHACAIDPNDEGNPYDTNRRLHPTDLIELLSGLVIVERRSLLASFVRPYGGLITLAHFSVNEYLSSGRLRVNGAPNFRLEESTSQQFIAASCILYIVASATAADTSADPLVYYASHYWPEHAQRIPEEYASTMEPYYIQLLNNINIRSFWVSECLSMKVFSTPDGVIVFKGFIQAPHQFVQTPAGSIRTKYNKTSLKSLHRDFIFPQLPGTATYPVKVCVDYQLLLALQTLLRSTDLPVICDRHECVLESAIIYDNLKFVELLAPYCKDHDLALNCVFANRRERAALYLINNGFELKPPHAALCARYCSKSMLEVFASRNMRLSASWVVEMLEGALHYSSLENWATIISILHQRDQTLLKSNKRETIYRRLVYAAARLDLLRSLFTLLIFRALFPSPECSYSRALGIAIEKQSLRATECLISLLFVRKQVKFAYFRELFKKTAQKAAFPCLRILLPFLLSSHDSIGRNLKAALLCHDKKAFENFIWEAKKCGSSRPCTEDGTILMAAMLDDAEAINKLHALGADITLCTALRDAFVCRDIATWLFSHGVPLKIHYFKPFTPQQNAARDLFMAGLANLYAAGLRTPYDYMIKGKPMPDLRQSFPNLEQVCCHVYGIPNELRPFAVARNCEHSTGCICLKQHYVRATKIPKADKGMEKTVVVLVDPITRTLTVL